MITLRTHVTNAIYGFSIFNLNSCLEKVHHIKTAGNLEYSDV